MWRWSAVVVGVLAALVFLYGLLWLAGGTALTLVRFIEERFPQGLLRKCLLAVAILGTYIGLMWVFHTLFANTSP